MTSEDWDIFDATLPEPPRPTAEQDGMEWVKGSVHALPKLPSPNSTKFLPGDTVYVMHDARFYVLSIDRTWVRS